MELSSEAQLLLLNLLPHHCGGINDKRDEDVENNKVYDHLDDCWVPRTAIGSFRHICHMGSMAGCCTLDPGLATVFATRVSRTYSVGCSGKQVANYFEHD